MLIELSSLWFILNKFIKLVILSDHTLWDFQTIKINFFLSKLRKCDHLVLYWQLIEYIIHHNWIHHNCDWIKKHEQPPQLSMHNKILILRTEYILICDGIFSKEVQHDISDNINKVEHRNAVYLLRETLVMICTL